MTEPYWLGSLDAFKGFWQFSYAETSEEVCSLMTDMEIYTPRRLIHTVPTLFQKGMMKVFSNIVYEELLIWIDNILAFHEAFEDYLVTLRHLWS